VSGRGRPTFGKLEREREKQAKAKAKRERRQAATTAEETPGGSKPPQPPAESAERVLALVDDLHERFANDEISFDDYEVEKAALLSRLTIE